MVTFSDEEYNDLISNLIKEANYIDVSNMNKMTSLRKHGEILVRKILDIGNDTQIMLGQVCLKSNNPVIKERMSTLNVDLQKKLTDEVKAFNRLVRDGSHTQRTTDYSDQEVKDAEDGIFELYAILFIKYFIDIGVGLKTSPHILKLFSILPPIIRFKVWSYLFEKDQNNVIVADKLCLAIIKKAGKGDALIWLKEKESVIRNMRYPSSDEIDAYNEMRIVEISPGQYGYSVSMDFSRYSNMYDLLKSKIEDPRTSMNESGKLYKSFEEALVFYKQIREVYANINETKDLTVLMDFVYIGRRESVNHPIVSVVVTDSRYSFEGGV